jgi:hypothetical protein
MWTVQILTKVVAVAEQAAAAQVRQTADKTIVAVSEATN